MLTQTADRLEKIEEIKRELKLRGHWKESMPEWVVHFQPDTEISPHDFFDWLQFIYLPNVVLGNRKTVGRPEGLKNLMPQAIEYLAGEPNQEKLVQLLVELDNMI